MLGAGLAEIRVPRRGAGRPRTTPEHLLGDKGYSSRANRALLAGRGIVVAGWTRNRRRDPRTRRPARQPDPTRPRRRAPIAFDKDAHKGRNIVERAFNRLKQWRGIATRYDKTAVNYRAGIVHASVTIWLTI